MRWSAGRTVALVALLAAPARAVESFLDGNMKLPEAIPYPTRVTPTPAATPARTDHGSPTDDDRPDP
jgi:hypothetical protein